MAGRRGDSASVLSYEDSIRSGTFTPIEADSADDDDTEISSTRSLRNSLIKYTEENGRIYNAYGSYLLPSDDIESERLNLQYVILQQLFDNRVNFAPVHKPRRIKDIGTGPGLWCVDIAKKFPEAQVFGTDISPAQFLEKGYPQTIHWIVEDADDGSKWGENYDYIHTRMMLGSFNDFRTIIARSFESLRPGGYMESQEMWPRPMCDDGTLDPETHKFTEYVKFLDEAMMRAAMPIRIANKLKKWYRDAGFVDVKEEIFRIPINGWPKDPRFKMLGKYWARSLSDGCQAFAMKAFTETFGWTREAVEVYLAGIRTSIADRSVHAYHTIYVVHGRKPTEAEQRSMNAQKAQCAVQVDAKYAVRPPLFPSADTHETHASRQNGHQPPLQHAERSNGNTNRRPRQPFSASPHANV